MSGLGIPPAVGVVLAVGGAAAGIAASVEAARRARRRERRVIAAQRARIARKIEEEARLAESARIEVLQRVPWLALGVVALGVAMAATPRRRRR